jgi:hypothetical protein
VVLKEYTDPDFGTRIFYSRNLVTIPNHLPLDKYASIPLTFRVHRDVLPSDTEQLFRTEEGIIEKTALLLQKISQDMPKGRKNDLSIPLPGFPSIRLRMNRGDIFRLQHFFEEEPPPGYTTHNEYLKLALLRHFFSSPFLLSLARPPRGDAAKTYPLTRHFTGAFFACRNLVSKAEGEGEESRLGKRMKEITKEMIEKGWLHDDLKELKRSTSNVFDLSKDFDLSLFIWKVLGEKPDALVVSLVHRAFLGAWKVFGHAGLLKANPKRVFNQYLYRKQRITPITNRLQIAAQDPDFYDKMTMKPWERLYLGEPGAAAKAFKLIEKKKIP